MIGGSDGSGRGIQGKGHKLRFSLAAIMAGEETCHAEGLVSGLGWSGRKAVDCGAVLIGCVVGFDEPGIDEGKTVITGLGRHWLLNCVFDAAGYSKVLPGVYKERFTAVGFQAIFDTCERFGFERFLAVTDALCLDGPVDGVEGGVIIGLDFISAGWAAVDVLALVASPMGALLPGLD